MNIQRLAILHLKPRPARRAASTVLTALAAFLTALCAGSATALAFDVGYHLELTRDALAAEAAATGPAGATAGSAAPGPAPFTADAIKLVQLSNYYDDGFSSAKTVIAGRWVRLLRLDDDWGALYGPAAARDASDAWLHFGNLDDYGEVAAVWDRLVRNTYRAAREAERRGDTPGLLAVLGMSLHQVQDFYAHSNWAEVDWTKGADVTWFDVPEAERSAVDLYTARPSADLGKDCADGPGFERAYREAYYASRQWVGLVRSWVGQDFWRVAASSYGAEVDEEQSFVRYLSWYTGHWKGPSSQSYDDLVALAPTYLRHADRARIAKWLEYCPLVTGDPDATVTPGPASGPAPPEPALVPPAPAEVPLAVALTEPVPWLEIRFSRVRQTDDDPVWDIDPLGEADFYAVVKVNGTEYLQAMHEDADDIEPRNWLTLVPLEPGGATNSHRVRLELYLWDEDVLGGGVLPSPRGDDDRCDIVPELGKRGWSAEGLAGDFRGGRAFVTDGFRYDARRGEPDGDGNEARVEFTVSLIEAPSR